MMVVGGVLTISYRDILIAALIVDRGDRPELTEFNYLRMQSQDYGQIDVIASTELDTGAADDEYDIVPRVQWMLEQAQDYEFVYLIENDDYYPTDYISRCEEVRDSADFINSNTNVRYNLAKRYYQAFGFRQGGMRIGGLWTMGVRPSILGPDFFQWVEPYERHLDSKICKYVQANPDIKDVWFNNHGGVAIKGHNKGLYKPDSPHRSFPNKVLIPNNLDSSIYEGVLQYDPELVAFAALTDMAFYNLHYGNFEGQTTTHQNETETTTWQ